MRRWITLCAAVSVLAACVPPKPPPPRPTKDQIAARAAKQKRQVKAKTNDRHKKRTDGLKGGKLIFKDNFNRESLGVDWEVKLSGEWLIRDGKLVATRVQVYDDRNQGVWLKRQLPKKARVEFTARVKSGSGDMKCELFARSASHEAGYSVIFGGWNNTINTISRLGEHEPKRVIQRPHTPVKTGQSYRWALVRTDNTLRWYLDGVYVAAYDDPSPVFGPYFGFNNWLSDVEFDDLAIYDLKQ